jgi:hypothetical protein
LLPRKSWLRVFKRSPKETSMKTNSMLKNLTTHRDHFYDPPNSVKECDV